MTQPVHLGGLWFRFGSGGRLGYRRRFLFLHLGGGLRLGRHLEDDPDPVDDELLAGEGDVLGGGEQARHREGDRLAEAAVDVALGSGRQERSELIQGNGHNCPGGVSLMKTKECPSCAMEIDAKAKVCPICQFEFPESSAWLKWAALLLIILFMLFYIL